MPIYEYECKECHHEFEELVMGGRSDQVRCPTCDSPEVKRLLSVTALKTDAGFVSTASGGGCSGCSGGSCHGCK